MPDEEAVPGAWQQRDWLAATLALYDYGADTSSRRRERMRPAVDELASNCQRFAAVFRRNGALRDFRRNLPLEL